MRPSSLRALHACLLLLFTVTILACDDDERGTPTATLHLEKVAGDSQPVAPHDTSAPLVVRVVDQDGDPSAGVVVEFAVDSGPGAMTVTADTSDAEGLVSAAYVATVAVGRRRVRATLDTVRLSFDVAVAAGAAPGIVLTYGDGQGASVDADLGAPLRVLVHDVWGNPVAGEAVTWAVLSGGGAVASETTTTDAAGLASVTRRLGPSAGGQETRAILVAAADTVVFHSTGRREMGVLGGGNNVDERCTGLIWVGAQHAYSATWKVGGCGLARAGATGVPILVWDVTGAPVRTDSVLVGHGGGNISDVEVSRDGDLLVATMATSGVDSSDGLYLYSLADPAHPVAVDSETVRGPLGVGTAPLNAAAFGEVGGVRYVFAGKGSTPTPATTAALTVYRIQVDSADKLALVATVPGLPTNVGDLVFREGLLYVSLGRFGVRVYDVGDGRAGGAPGVPALVSSIALNGGGIGGAWPYTGTGGRRYLFVSELDSIQVDPGRIRVVDITDLSAPAEVASFGVAGDTWRTPRELWADDARGILYVNYLFAGVIALDMTGQLSGDLAGREIARILPGDADASSFDVKFANGFLWVSDQDLGLWKVSAP
jgi:hypothetical protein